MVRVLVLGSPTLTLGEQCHIALLREGHESKYLNYRKFHAHRIGFTNTLLNKWLIRVCRSFKPELVFTLKGESLTKGTMTEMKKTGARTICWVLDEPTGKYYLPGRITNLDEYDMAISFDNFYLPLIRKLGCPKAFFLPIGVEETVFKEVVPLLERKYEYDVAFLGTYGEPRAELFSVLADKNLALFGPGWEKLSNDHQLKPHVQNQEIYGPKTCEYFNKAKININQTHPHALDGGINLRIPEVLSTKSFLLTNDLKGLNKLFTPGKDLETYSSAKELKEKVEYYLAHDDERNKIAEAGYRRILREHTLRLRMRELLKIAGF